MRIPFFVGKKAATTPGQMVGNTQRGKKPGLSWVFMAFLVFIALLMGMVTALDAPILLVVLVGAVFGTLLFFLLPAQGLLLSLFVITFLVQGTAQYFLGLRQATWVAVGMAVLFFFRFLMDMAVQSNPRRPYRPGSLSGVMVALTAYAACYAFSLFVNRPHAAQLAASIKSVWPMFSVLLAFYWMHWDTEKFKLQWLILVGVGVMQLPVVTYQHFLGAGSHFGSFDSIVGTFGGTPLAGGLSSILVFFTIMIMAYCMASWNRGQMSRLMAFSVFGIGMAIVLLGEVKAAFIWLPIVMFMVLRRRIMKNIFTLVMYGVVAVAMLGSIYVVYNALYWTQSVDRQHGVAGKLTSGGGYFFDVNNVDYHTGEISRGASIALWVRDGFTGPGKRIIGYGPGASKSNSALGVGEVMERFRPLRIDATALAVLLWDTGIAGALAYCAIPAAGLLAGRRFLRAGLGSPAQLASVETCTAMMVLFLSLLCYNRTVMDEPTAQLLLMFCLGCIVQAVRYGPDTMATATPAALPSLAGRHAWPRAGVAGEPAQYA